jgi:hypothetical protein
MGFELQNLDHQIRNHQIRLDEGVKVASISDVFHPDWNPWITVPHIRSSRARRKLHQILPSHIIQTLHYSLVHISIRSHVDFLL